MSLFAKLVRGASVNVLEHGLKVVAMFFTTPLMIHHLGKEEYGTWLLALAIIAYFRLLDLGFSFAGSRYLGKALGSGNRQEYRLLAGSLFRIYVRIGLASIALTILAVWLLPYFIGSAATVATVRMLVAGFGVVTALRFFTRIYEVMLKSHVRYDLIGISSIIKTFLQAGLVIGLLLSGHGLLTLLVAHILVDVLDQFLLVLFGRRVEAGLRLGGSREDGSRTGELLRYSATATVTTAGHSLRQGIDPLVITHVSGVAALPIYSIGTRFLGVFTDFVNAIFGGNFIAAFSQLHGRGDIPALNQRFMQSIRFSTIVAMVGGCGLMIFGPVFIECWVGPDFAVSGKILWILAPVTTLSLCQYPVWSLFYSQDKQQWLAGLALLGGVFNLALSLFLASRIGWIGVVWATCVEVILVSGLVTPLLVSRVCHIPLGRYLAVMAVPGLKIALFSAVCWLAIFPFATPAYDRLLMLGIGYLALLAPVAYFFVLDASERSWIRQWLGRG